MAKQDEIKLELGDRVLVEDNDLGTVVFSTISDRFSTNFPKEAWGHMKPGVMIETDAGALIFFDSEYLKSEFCKIVKIDNN
jgi:hypothetical protein